MEATRQLFWNANGQGYMYFFALLSGVIFIVGCSLRIGSWQQGKKIHYDNLGLRFKKLFSAIIRHDKGIYKGTFRRFMHLGVFYGFVVLTIGTLIIAIQDHLGIPLFYGKKYLILSLLMDLFGLLAMIGIGMATYKRYIDKPDHEDYTFDDAFLLLLVFIILFTGFILEGLRIYITNDPWANWTPVGLFFSTLIQITGLSLLSAQLIHAILWSMHMLLAFGFIAYIPYSKLFHMFASGLNIYLRSFSSIGELSPVDISNKITSGAACLEDFSNKQLLELDACISCGRCQKGCPAYMSGAPLSPRVVIQRLKNHTFKRNSLLRNRSTTIFKDSLIDTVISKETLWSCTTCGLCEDKCPIYIEHIKRIVDMRRSLSTEATNFPIEVQKVFHNISEVGNPWGLSSESKFYLAKELHVPIISENAPADILYWAGCFGSYESRNTKVSQVMFELFEKAGVDYVLLGREEQCCGDSLRRLGNEKLFRQLAQENIRNLNRYNFKTIVTSCSHCYNTLKNDYPQFGGHYQVLHHTEYIFELIKSVKIKPKRANDIKVTFHDPCYLGRYNSIYNAPRDVLTSIPGLELVEMKNNRAKAFCCGAGGGRIWMEDIREQKINSILVRKALPTKSDILASACSLCLVSLSEAVRSQKTDIQSMDIAEIVYNTL